MARIQPVVEQTAFTTPEPQPQAPAGRNIRPITSERIIPPRTRAYARELGISDDLLAAIPSVTAKLMPADIDAYRAAQGGEPAGSEPPGGGGRKFVDLPLSDRQRKLNFHMKRSAQIVIPGTVSRPIAWTAVRDYAAKYQVEASGRRPTEFQVFAYCVVQAIHSCPKFLCSLLHDDTVRQYERLNLGVAVALNEGELATAVVTDADGLSLTDLAARLHERVQAARAGNDQADATVQVLLSYLGAHGIRDAVPVLVAPAVAVMFIGEAYEQESRLYSNVSLTFDHRLINGVEAAEMLKSAAHHVQLLTNTDLQT